jgi:hypothetical protein
VAEGSRDISGDNHLWLVDPDKGDTTLDGQDTPQCPVRPWLGQTGQMSGMFGSSGEGCRDRKIGQGRVGWLVNL